MLSTIPSLKELPGSEQRTAMLRDSGTPGLLVTSCFSAGVSQPVSCSCRTRTNPCYPSLFS